MRRLFFLLFIFSPFISKAQRNFIDKVYPLILSDSNQLDQLDELRELQQYYIDNKDTIGLLGIYEKEKAYCESKQLSSVDYGVCIHNMISGYMDYMSKEDLLKYVALYSKDTSVMFNSYIYGALASIFIRHGNIDSAVYYLSKSDSLGDCRFSPKKYNLNKAVDQLEIYCGTFQDKKSALEFFKSAIGKLPNGNCISTHFDEYSPIYNKDLEIFKAALYLGEYSYTSLRQAQDKFYLEKQEIFKGHFEELIKEGKMNIVLENIHRLQFPDDRLNLLTSSLFYKLPESIEKQVLDSIFILTRDVIEKNKRRIFWPYENVGLLKTVEQLLKYNDIDRAKKFAKVIEKDHSGVGLIYCRIANYLIQNTQLKEAMECTDHAFRNPKVHDIETLGEVARLYKLLGKESKKEEVLSLAEKRVSKIKWEYVSDTEKLVIAYSKAGEFDKAFSKSLLFDNQGTGSPRSAMQFEIYRQAFINGDTATGLKFLEAAVKELPSIEHLHQKHWYIREAAVQYVLVKKYDKAFEVAMLMHTNELDQISRTLEELVKAYIDVNKVEIPFSYLDSFLKAVNGCPVKDRHEVGLRLAELFSPQVNTQNAEDFEDKLLDYVCPTDTINYDQLRFQLQLFAITKNQPAYEKALSMGEEKALALKTIPDQVKALIELQKFQDQLASISK